MQANKRNTTSHKLVMHEYADINMNHTLLYIRIEISPITKKQFRNLYVSKIL